MLRSCICTQRQLESEAFVSWAQKLRPAWDSVGDRPPVILHRKLWEWLFIVQALHERGMLQGGSRGLGFGVGIEPLAAFFASLGSEIVATNISETECDAARWIESGQHSNSLSRLNEVGLCPVDLFAKGVSFRHVNMNNIPSDLTGFDFTWSACALEHLGSIKNGQQFLLNQMKCLKPGGVAIHTTEFNLSSNFMTLDWIHTVLFRRRDIEYVVRRLRNAGHDIDVDFDPGSDWADQHVDVPPFSDVHLRLLVEKYKTTSIALIIGKTTKPCRSSSERVLRPIEGLDYVVRLAIAKMRNAKIKFRAWAKKRLSRLTGC